MANTFKQYEIWHDESKINGYHHGILLMPLDKKDKIIETIKKIRDEHKYDHKYDLKYASTKNGTCKGRLISNMLELFTHIIQTRITQPTKLYNRSGKDIYAKNYEHYLELNELYDCRFGLLKVKENYESTYFNNNEIKIETTLRFILKCCCHGMFSKDTPIEIVKLYLDGDKHHKNNINLQRILKGEFRDYCKIADNITYDARHIEDRNDDTKLLINLVDNVTGAWRSILNKETNKKEITRPLQHLAERIKNKLIFKNKNSRWYRSIALTEFVTNEDGEIEFPGIFRNQEQQNMF